MFEKKRNFKGSKILVCFFFVLSGKRWCIQEMHLVHVYTMYIKVSNSSFIFENYMYIYLKFLFYFVRNTLNLTRHGRDGGLMGYWIPTHYHSLETRYTTHYVNLWWRFVNENLFLYSRGKVIVRRESRLITLPAIQISMSFQIKECILNSSKSKRIDSNAFFEKLPLWQNWYELGKR